jgi:hypothetical protein
MRSKHSASQRRCSAWIGVRPLSIRASTGTPTFSAAFSTASRSGIAISTSWCIAASSANSNRVTTIREQVEALLGESVSRFSV